MKPLQSFQDATARTCVTDTTVCPDRVLVAEFGHHSSRVYADQRRWVFESEEARDRFVAAVGEGRFRRKKT